MILVDTNVIINFLNNPADEIRRVFCGNRCAICGVVKAEVLRGSRSENDFCELERRLSAFEFLPFSDLDWTNFAKTLVLLREKGIAVPFQDAMIAYLAIKFDCEVLTFDRHFALMKSALPNLRIFDKIVLPHD